jgi:hypothetical protein
MDFTLALYIIVLVAFLVVPFLYLLTLRRRYDIICFYIGYYLIIAFFVLAFTEGIIGMGSAIPETIGSLVIGLLTLALVWVELDKRAELLLMNPIPLAWNTKNPYGPGYESPEDELSFQESSWMKAGTVTFLKKKLFFDNQFAFKFDVTNLGNEKIMLNKYYVYVDGNKINKQEFKELPSIDISPVLR